MAFEYIEHTSEIGFRATASSLDGVFVESAKALTGVMTDQAVACTRSVALALEAESLEALFFDFLAELVVFLDAELLFVADAHLRVEQIDSGWRICGDLLGDDAGKYETHGDVKAPTYHELSIEEVDGVWVATATLDI